MGFINFINLCFFSTRFVFLVFVSLAICFALYGIPAQTLEIKFPEEELASESVLPLIDSPQMVLNRNVPLKHRLEIGGSLGFGLDEPFYGSELRFFPGLPYNMALHLAFHLTEIHSVSLLGTYFPPGLINSIKKNLVENGVPDIDDGKRKYFDPSKVSYPQYVFFLNYQHTPYYGKISLTKSKVMNLSIYGFVGLGQVVFNDNNRTMAFDFGIGEKLYFNKWFGLRLDLGLYGYYGPDPSKNELGREVQGISYDQVKKGFVFNILFNMGLIALI